MLETHLPIRVVKIGGSLLDLDDLRERMTSWLSNQFAATNIWIVGGGKQADEVRVSNLPEEESHWLAIEAMEFNTKKLSAQFPIWKTCDNVDSIGRFMLAESSTFFLPLGWLKSCEVLPHSWDVTSDSIAAALAENLNSIEVVLLKSSAARGKALTEVANENLVDNFFPIAARKLKTRLVNLRSKSFDEQLFVPS